MALETVLHSVRLPHRIDRAPPRTFSINGSTRVSERKIATTDEETSNNSSRISVKIPESCFTVGTSNVINRLVPVPVYGDCYTDSVIRFSPIDFTVDQQFSLLWSLCVSESIEDGNLLQGFSASSAAVQSVPPPRQSQEDPEKQDFHVNIGYAIRTLREEMPCLFYKELSYDIYRKDIVFRDPMNTVMGIKYYKLIFRALRFYGRVFFKALWVDILRIWQPSDNVIMVRWQVRGIPRVPWEAQGIFDGTSEYKLDKQGKIYEHKVDNIALNARPKLKVPTVEELLQVGTCPSTPKPTFFQQIQGPMSLLLPCLFQFTWVRYYFALRGTLNLYQNPDMLL